MKIRIKPILFSYQDLKLNPLLYPITPSICSRRCFLQSPVRCYSVSHPKQPLGDGALLRLFHLGWSSHPDRPRGTLARDADLS
ncbi:MAG: hypothetical protein KGZ49_10695 [Syntrophaceae bacterium]|nr:hypothetical protein [Syntrophaceae bacterium]